MSVNKIVGWVGLLVAIVAAFATVPYAALVLLVAGLVVGWSIAGEDHVRVLVSALVLAGLAGAFNAVPEVGQYLTSIVANIGTMAAGAALMIVLCNIYKRFKP